MNKLTFEDLVYQVVIIVGQDNIPTNGWRNVSKTSKRHCSCGTWLNHWENLSNHRIYEKCRAVNCNECVDDGCHVENPAIKGEYIVPLCRSHNHHYDEIFSLEKGTILVSANKAKTCDK